MSNKKKKDREKIIAYIKEVWGEISSICSPLLRYHQTSLMNEKCNDSGGSVAIRYQPEGYTAELLVFKDMFYEMPSRGFTKGYKAWIKSQICHEAGHMYLWEMEGTKRDTEKMATLIGNLIFQVLDKEGI